jgi:hypothetical protein
VDEDKRGLAGAVILEGELRPADPVIERLRQVPK